MPTHRTRRALFLTCCTSAVAAKRGLASLHIVGPPPDLAVGADHGLVVLKEASADSAPLANYLLGGRATEMLEAAGFALP